MCTIICSMSPTACSLHPASVLPGSCATNSKTAFMSPGKDMEKSWPAMMPPARSFGHQARRS